MTTNTKGHVLVDTTAPSNQYAIFCDHCGACVRVLLPLSVDDMVALTQGFVRAHSDCPPRAPRIGRPPSA